MGEASGFAPEAVPLMFGLLLWSHSGEGVTYGGNVGAGNAGRSTWRVNDVSRLRDKPQSPPPVSLLSPPTQRRCQQGQSLPVKSLVLSWTGWSCFPPQQWRSCHWPLSTLPFLFFSPPQTQFHHVCLYSSQGKQRKHTVLNRVDLHLDKTQIRWFLFLTLYLAMRWSKCELNCLCHYSSRGLQYILTVFQTKPFQMHVYFRIRETAHEDT